MKNIVLMGAPGAGKGTQANLLVKRYGMQHLSTGEMLRQQATGSTSINIAIRHLIDEGRLVSDEIIMQLIASKIDENIAGNGFIFDGVPRTAIQAQMLDEMLHAKGIAIHAAILLETTENELVERMLVRGKISGRADDQNQDTIRQRIRIYHEKTEPLTTYYKRQGKFFVVSGMGKMDDIFNQLAAAIEEIML
jgi:adenylate kinase